MINKKEIEKAVKNIIHAIGDDSSREGLIDTPKRVSKASGLYLHQFKWTKEKLIGELPKNWNILVGEQKIPKKINALHYTLGGPWFKKHSKCAGSKHWFYYKKRIFGKKI